MTEKLHQLIKVQPINKETNLINRKQTASPFLRLPHPFVDVPQKHSLVRRSGMHRLSWHKLKPQFWHYLHFSLASSSHVGSFPARCKGSLLKFSSDPSLFSSLSICTWLYHLCDCVFFIQNSSSVITPANFWVFFVTVNADNLKIFFLAFFSWVTLWVSVAVYLTCTHWDIKALFHAGDWNCVLFSYKII